METETLTPDTSRPQENGSRPPYPAVALLKSLWPPEVKEDLPRSYPLSLLAIAGLLVIMSLAGWVPWVVSFLATLALTATLVRHGMFVTVSAVLAIGLIIISPLFADDASQPVAPPPLETEAEPIQAAAPDSLGIRFPDLPDLWNAVDAQPKITKGLTVNSEPGDYDSFIYRFEDWGRFAGAYDPETGSVYGLLATGQFTHRATGQLYLHLCFMVQPYSQKCIDDYFEIGLDGEELRFFADSTHNATWTMNDQTWILEIDSNVLTIRVLAEAVD